jgi:hypothetical protein
VYLSGVLDFVKAHPYLFAYLPTLIAVIWLPRLASNRDYARAAVFSGLACLPCSLAEITAEAYWRPDLLGGARCGIEDLIFTYSVGSTAWLISALYKFEYCTLGIRSYRTAFLRLLPMALAVTAIYIGLWLAGINCVTATLVVSAGLLLFLLSRRLSLWRLALAGLVSFTPIYVFEEKLQFVAWPNYLSYWNTGGLWGTLVFGIPLGEIAWAAAFGAVCPVVIASVLDITFDCRNTQDSIRPSFA